MLRSLFVLIFMGFLLFSAGCSEGFLVAAIDLNRLGGSGEPPLPMYSQRVVLGFFVGCWVEVCSGGSLLLRCAVIAVSRIKSIVISYLLEGASRPRMGMF